MKIGIYLDHVPEFSIIGSHWKADFYVWFNWEGPDLAPGETFHVTNGEVLSKNLVEKRDDGNSHYALYRVTAQISKAFDVGQRVEIPGFKIIDKQASVRPYSYQTARGNSKLPQGYKSTYSQFDYFVWIARPTWSLHLKMFVVMYGAVFIALLGFLLKSSADRLVLVSGSLFAAVANMYLASTLIPDTGVGTLADHINWIGAAFIMVVIVQAVIYQFSFEGREDRREVTVFYDAMNFGIMLPFYLLLNVALPMLASIGVPFWRRRKTRFECQWASRIVG